MDERDVAEQLTELVERAVAFAGCTVTAPVGEAPGLVIADPHHGTFLVTVTLIEE
jgi:hypothetical protein